MIYFVVFEFHRSENSSIAVKIDVVFVQTPCVIRSHWREISFRWQIHTGGI